MVKLFGFTCSIQKILVKLNYEWLHYKNKSVGKLIRGIVLLLFILSIVYYSFTKDNMGIYFLFVIFELVYCLIRFIEQVSLVSLRKFFKSSLFIVISLCFFATGLVWNITGNYVVSYFLFCVLLFFFWNFLSLIANNNIAKITNEITSIIFGVLLLIKDTLNDMIPESIKNVSYIEIYGFKYIDEQVLNFQISLIVMPIFIINASALVLCTVKGYWINNCNKGKDLKLSDKDSSYKYE